jgi:hypothetical protein
MQVSTKDRRTREKKTRESERSGGGKDEQLRSREVKGP